MGSTHRLHLYRALDKFGNTIDFYLSATRNTEVMRALRKGQAEMFALQSGIVGEARIVERAFGVGPCALTEAMAWLQDRLASAET